MLPLDTVCPYTHSLRHPAALDVGLAALRSVGVHGVAVDVWWVRCRRIITPLFFVPSWRNETQWRNSVSHSPSQSHVEPSPGSYDFAAYRELAARVAAAGLTLQVVLSFHSCGCNVGDSCVVPLPPWVLSAGRSNPDVFFADRAGRRSEEARPCLCSLLFPYPPFFCLLSLELTPSALIST